MKYIKFFNEITIKDVPLVGGKNASLGEMVQKLGKRINIPDGFAVTASAIASFDSHLNRYSRVVPVIDGIGT